MVNATKTENQNMLEWMDEMSKIDPKTRAQQIFNNTTDIMRKFAADVLFYRQKPDAKLDLYIAKWALEIMKPVTKLIPPISSET